MKFSLDRNTFVAKKLGNLNGESILDIGCRDMVLKTHLKGSFEYTGLDFNNPNDQNKYTKILNHNLENGLPDNLEKFDIINALDVLEHLENIHSVFNALFDNSKNKIVIALPNMAYYKFRLNFLLTGILSKKYLFSEKKIGDRHRWIPNYYSINSFIKENTPSNWDAKFFYFVAERKRNFIFYYLEKFLSKFFPNLFIYETILIFTKKN